MDRRRSPWRGRVALAGAIGLALGISGVASGAAAHQTVAPVWHAMSGHAGPVDGASASLVRRDGGVSYRFHATNLKPGHAYTLWFVALDNPGACAADPCNGPDIFNNSSTDAQVTFGGGHVVGGSGNATFAGSKSTGPLAGWLANRSFDNPLAGEIHLVINDHGALLPGYMPDMIHTYRGGCQDAGLPPIFPASAKADGEPGPNSCVLTQAAIFRGD